MTDQDKEVVRQAAAGQWPQILTAVGGIAPELLDPSREHPCPKCDGDTRFRMVDEEAGAVRCSHCFSTKCGDGFAAISWLRGVKFPEAVQLVADHLGVKLKGKAADPAKDLEFQPWAPALVAHFVKRKSGVTEEALRLCGARLAKYKKTFTVIALPVIGATLDVDNPVGWVLLNCLADTLPRWNKKGEVVGQVKHKLTYGSKPGLLGVHAIERFKTEGLPELVWKVEGVSDLLAVQAAIPETLRDRHLVVTNANGAGETPKATASILARFKTNVLHDADKPGQAGAVQWAQAIAMQSEGEVRNVQLPYAVDENHGKDVRDWLGEGRSYGDLQNLADGADPVTVPRTASGEIDHTQVDMPMQREILKRLQLEVLYEEEGGTIRVFSTLLRKSSSISNVRRLDEENLIQIAGTPAMVHISSDPDGSDTWSLKDVRKAIAYAASTRRGKHDERGVGVWQGLDDYGNETNTVVLVNNTEAARWNGDMVLRRIIAPRADGLVLNFGAGDEDWFQFELLERNIKSAGDEQWCQDVIGQAVGLFERWRWRNQEIDPTLVTGLVLASWVQTVWKARPLVSISGESNAGKSYLFEALGGSDQGMGVFGALAFKQSQSTAAGIRQGVGKTATVILCDEFEQSRERQKILQMFRNSIRGDKTAQGSAAQKVKEFNLRHVGWVAAIESGLTRQPDANRFIQLELLRPKRSDHGKLTLPEGRWLWELGQKLLAIAVRHAVAAKATAVALKSISCDDVDARTVECYAVPAAMLGAANHFDFDRTKGLLEDLLAGVERDDQGEADHDDLLQAILSTQINCGGKDGMLTVAQILGERGHWYHDHAARVEAIGIRLTDENGLFVCHKQLASSALRHTPWEGQKIDSLLLRIHGARRTRLRVCGRLVRGVEIPAAELGFGQHDFEGF